MNSVDLSIVASRRPDLLAATLKGFSHHFFSRISINDVFLNIDPIFGGENEHRECIEVARSYFPNVNIFEPEVPGFCSAVRRVWSATSSDYVFHLEDDWVPISSFGNDLFSKFDDKSIAQVSFHHDDRKWDIAKKGNIHYMRLYKRIFGIKIPTLRLFPRFSTAPSLLVGPFARRCAALMMDGYDPEKQFYGGLNADLENFVRHYRNYIYSNDGSPIIRDLGRSWSAQRGIVKRTQGGRSEWSVKESEVDGRQQ